MTLKKIHRTLGVFAAVFWLIQVITGVGLVFRHELGNATLSGESAPANVAALGERIESIRQGGGKVSSMWVASFARNRFDVYYTDLSHTDRIMRVDGTGHILRDGPESELFAHGGLLRTLTTVHTSLMAGDFGKWVVAISGALLFSNLIMGLKLAWPRAGTWRQSLALQPVRHPTARLYGIHRTVGLWIVLPLLVIVLAGVALRFDDDVERVLGVVQPDPVGAPAGSGLTPVRALETALARFPGSTITALSMPSDDEPWYRVRVHARGEVPRMYGTTTVFLSAVDGAVLKEYVASTAPFARTFYETLYPLHTGELGKLPGRLLLAALGLMLLTTGVFGIRLWLGRRKPRPLQADQKI